MLTCLADDEAERVAGWVAVDPPGHRLTIRAWPGRDVLGDQRGASGQHPGMSGGQVFDQDVEMNPRRVPDQGRGGGLAGEPLTVRRRLERDPSGVPLNRGAAEQGWCGIRRYGLNGAGQKQMRCEYSISAVGALQSPRADVSDQGSRRAARGQL